MKPVLVAMNNPYSDRPDLALYPAPHGSAGARLWRMLHEARPRVVRRDYLDGFERYNLVYGDWDPEVARQRAWVMALNFQGQTVVLLGEEVRRAFNVPKLLIHPQVKDGVTYRQLPHPSGRNPWYNDSVHRLLAGMLLSELLG